MPTGVKEANDIGLKKQENAHNAPNISTAKVGDEGDFIELQFEDGSKGRLAFQWLRDNCRCQECYDFVALSRIFELDQLSDDLFPQKVWLQDSKLLNIVWNSHDNHHSVYEKEWLYIRGFISKGKQIYENFRHLEKQTWGKEVVLDTFEYDVLLKDDRALLDYLITIEKKGIALIKNAPTSEGTGANFVNKIAHVRRTQFGQSCTVKVEDLHRYPGFTSKRLGLHTDICYYEECSLVIFIHTLKQHTSKGGESIVADGFYCAELLRQNHPEAFNMITSTDAYFWDRFNPQYHSSENRFKICKSPIIKLNDEGEIEKITFNNNKRDTSLEVSEDKVNCFYEAFNLFLNILYDNSYVFKMDPGDIVAMDNLRCLHGREEYSGFSERHLEVSYLDWDEAKSRRRLLQEQHFGQHIYQ